MDNIATENDTMQKKAIDYIRYETPMEQAHLSIVNETLNNACISENYRTMMLRHLMSVRELKDLSQDVLRQIAAFLTFADRGLLADYIRMLLQLTKTEDANS